MRQRRGNDGGIGLASTLCAALLASGSPGPAALAGAEARGEDCAFLGDRLRGLPDVDAFTFQVRRGEQLAVRLSPADDPRNRGQRARLRLERRVAEAWRPLATGAGALPLDLDATLRIGGLHRVRVEPLPAAPPAASRAPRSTGAAAAYHGAYCIELRSSDAAAASLAPGPEVEVQWVALAEGASVLPPFVRQPSGAGDGRIQPEQPLRGGRVYGLVVTSGARGLDGRPLEADAAFRARKGTHEPARGGPVARFHDDPLHPANPFPEARLVGPAGIVLPDRVVLRGLDPADPTLAAARANLRSIAAELARLHGFSTTAPLRLALSAPLDLATLTPEHVLLFERADGRLDLGGLLAEAARHGVRPEEVALALSFPTQRIEDDLRAVAARLAERAAAGFFELVLDDPDPTDALPLGVFTRNAGPDAPFAALLAAQPQLAAVVAGLLPSLEFRGPDRIFDPERLSGRAPAEEVALDFLLTVPATSPPYPVLLLQHGFAGSNAIVLDLGAHFAEDGFAVIGISALAHGRRGNPFELLSARPLEAREIFRQTVADQMALLRALEHGVDLDRDGRADLDARDVGYLGISLGGLLGGVLIGAEPRLLPAVLNVAGGRVAWLAQAPGVRAFTQEVLAAQVGLEPGSARFETYLARLLELGELAQNPADPLNWARRYRRLPLAGALPRRLLLQQGEGDALVVNAFSEELAAVAGLASNRPARDADGLAGHWIFGPPGGHGIFARPDVRAQARTFLATRGTEIVDPAR